MNCSEVRSTETTVEGSMDYVRPHRFSPFHLPIFVFAQKINFANILRVRPIHQQIS